MPCFHNERTMINRRTPKDGAVPLRGVRNDRCPIRGLRLQSKCAVVLKRHFGDLGSRSTAPQHVGHLEFSRQRRQARTGERYQSRLKPTVEGMDGDTLPVCEDIVSLL